MYLLYMTDVDSYVNMSVDDLTTELNTLKTKRSKHKIQQFVDELIAYKRENPNDASLLTKLQQQTTLARRDATTQPNLPDDLRQAYRSARQSSTSRQSGGKSRKHGKSKKSRKSRRRR